MLLLILINMITNKIKDIENKIKALDDIQGFKKTIDTYNKIQKELDHLKSEIDDMENLINNNNNNEQIEQITDEQYTDYLIEIDSLIKDFDNLEINQQIELYHNMIHKIKICDNYLKSCKMEIIYHDKK